MNTVYTNDSSVFINSPLVPGERYLVTFDGQDYECIAASYTSPREEEDGMQTITYIGTQDFVLEGAQYPFIIQHGSVPVHDANSGAESFTLMVATSAEGESHTISIRQLDVVVKPLDADALPVLYMSGQPVNLLQAFMFMVEAVANNYPIPAFTLEAPSSPASSVEEPNSSGGSSSSGDNGR